MCSKTTDAGMNIIGTCSLCGGPVGVPEVYWSTVPPVPKCLTCGATKADPYGPTIKMTPRKPTLSEILNGDPLNGIAQIGSFNNNTIPSTPHSFYNKWTKEANIADRIERIDDSFRYHP